MQLFRKTARVDNSNGTQPYHDLVMKLIDSAVSSGCSYSQIRRAMNQALDFVERSTYPAYCINQYGDLVSLSGEKPVDQNADQVVCSNPGKK